MIEVDVLIFLKRNKILNFLHLVFSSSFCCTPLLGSNKLYSNNVNGTNSEKAAAFLWINLA